MTMHVVARCIAAVSGRQIYSAALVLYNTIGTTANNIDETQANGRRERIGGREGGEKSVGEGGRD